MGSYAFRLNGAALEAHPAGVLWRPERRVLAVANMHPEKDSSYARAGVFLPPYDSHSTVDRLAAVVMALNPVRVVAMGDSFHDDEAGSRLDQAAAGRLAALTRQCEWIWLTGNHDPAPAECFTRNILDEWQEGHWFSAMSRRKGGWARLPVTCTRKFGSVRVAAKSAGGAL